ncbi:MAG: Lrp/AsnC family transcriptional regulator [Oscillospiraceae bacterium]|jgi:Lrp/AsnC family leucine-responsive transcriptional regulator|nr:Lrp/AsnC family transcriptional regulator [Oscillospiraceae bacterium]
MDVIDKEILALLRANGRMPVKEIASRVSLTSPAVSERIHRLERLGIIAGYTVLERRSQSKTQVDALVNISVPTGDRRQFLDLIESRTEVTQCFHVTGSYSYMVRVCCPDMQGLENLINTLQKLGQTSTQIILSTPIDRPLG